MAQIEHRPNWFRFALFMPKNLHMKTPLRRKHMMTKSKLGLSNGPIIYMISSELTIITNTKEANKCYMILS